MGIAATVWCTWLILAALIWLSRHWEIHRSTRHSRPLAPDTWDAPPQPPPKVSLLVAAKDEQDNIESCIRSLLRQDYPDFEIIAVNDRSTDRTGEILDRLAAEAPPGRLTVLHIDTLPPGWAGKCHALHHGVRRATGRWLCFTDADCRQTSERTLTVAVRHAVENRIDFLSVLPVLETRSIWERIVQPVAGAVMVLWFNPRRVNDPRSATAYANGAFMLISRRTYDDIGGHHAVRTELNEDMKLAWLAKRRGWRLVVTQNRGLYRTRMYGNFREIWNGWSRIFYGCFGSTRRLLISAAVLTLMSLVPYFSVPAALIGLAVAPTAPLWPLVLLSALAASLASQTVVWRYYRLSQADPRYAPTYPIGCLLCLGMLLNALRKVTGRSSVRWRGTVYATRPERPPAPQPPPRAPAPGTSSADAPRAR